jgi:hypothetical protein
MNAQTLLAPLLAGNLAEWKGLGPLSVEQLQADYGPALETQDEPRWHGAAERLDFDDFIAWAERGTVCMVQPRRLPDDEWLARLGSPTVVLPHEIAQPGGYVHEMLYLPRGLVLSAYQPFGQQKARRIVRCRGFTPLADVEEYQVRFHHDLDDEDRYSEAPEATQ